MPSETDAEFLDSMEQWVIGSLVFKREHRERLFALARRGAAVENHGQVEKLSEEIERLRASLDAAQQAFASESYNASQLRAALREIAKVTRGWEPGVWTEEEGRQYFAALFFGAQKVARAALGEEKKG